MNKLIIGDELISYYIVKDIYFNNFLRETKMAYFDNMSGFNLDDIK